MRSAGIEEIRELGYVSLDQLVVVVPKECVAGITRNNFV